MNQYVMSGNVIMRRNFQLGLEEYGRKSRYTAGEEETNETGRAIYVVTSCPALIPKFIDSLSFIQNWAVGEGPMDLLAAEQLWLYVNSNMRAPARTVPQRVRNQLEEACNIYFHTIKSSDALLYDKLMTMYGRGISPGPRPRR